MRRLTMDEALDALAAAKPRRPNQHTFKTHCKHGHPYSGANLYVSPTGKRACRTCGNLRWAKRWLKIRSGLLRPEYRTHCPQGHPYDDTNTYRYPMMVSRKCRMCDRLNRRKARAQERGAK